MDSCCEGKARALEPLRVSQAKMLKLVLAIHAVMFFVEVVLASIAAVAALFILSAVGVLRESVLQLRTKTPEEGDIA
jgi:hypothetical protein